MAVQGGAGAVVAHGGAGVGVSGGDLDVAQVDAGVEHGGDVGVAQHVGVHAWESYAGGVGEVAQASGGGVSVQAAPGGVEQQRPFGTGGDSSVDGAGDGWWQGHQDDLVSLSDDAQDAVAVLFAEVGDVQGACFEDAQPQEARRHTRAKSHLFWDVREAVSSASSCRWLSPSVGDSGGTLGRRTWSAGECSRSSSMTQVR